MQRWAIVQRQLHLKYVKKEDNADLDIVKKKLNL